MNIRTAACAALLTLAVATTSCSSADSTDDKPATPSTATVSTAPAVDQATDRQACVDAIAAIPADERGEVPSGTTPAECTGLSEGDYLDAYMDAIAQANQEGRDALQDLIDENAQP